MANLGTWGTEVEIYAMATILNTRIFVFGNYGHVNKWLEFKPLPTNSNDLDVHSNEVILMNNLSHHYEPA